MITGGCLCGAVRYEVDGPLKHITHCHCSMCRKQHGAAFATYSSLKRSRIRITGATTAYASSSRGRREFCPTCGSSLFWSANDHPDVIAVALGTVDGDPIGRPEQHIHTDSAAVWYQICDDLPRR